MTNKNVVSRTNENLVNPNPISSNRQKDVPIQENIKSSSLASTLLRRSALTNLNNNTSTSTNQASSTTAKLTTTRKSFSRDSRKSAPSRKDRQVHIKSDIPSSHRLKPKPASEKLPPSKIIPKDDKQQRDQDHQDDQDDQDDQDQDDQEDSDNVKAQDPNITQEKQINNSTLTTTSSNKRSAPESFSDQVDKRARIDYTWDDLDEEDIDDPLMVSEYVVEIFEYLHKLEQKTVPDHWYFSMQPRIQPKMRTILVDWLVEIHLRFKLLPETLFLAINLMDRFLSVEAVEVEKFQLLAVSCLFIAAKYEEVYSPSVKNYAVVTDDGYVEQEILDAEKAVVEVLEFDLSYPNPMNFLRRISKADDYEVRTRTMGKYLLEIFTVDNEFIGVLPSMAAATAMYVARKILGRGPWNNNLIHYSGGYTQEDLAEVSESLVRYLVSPIVHEQFFKKYASRKFMKVSIIARQWAKQLVARSEEQ
ncbi:B-type cyclin [Saccharomycopsis crataegensis]|uniref:B-type cyclin n=1 Tax=Saccharomycopsis crataegensis TaxID=43959 RepID=A0AAV5QLD7_9ASCO|nr:B-type cyclin [Saccharomycopsis crataegensis]